MHRLANVPNEAINLARCGWAKVRGNGVSAYWYNYYNAGDQVTPVLLNHYGFTPCHALPRDAKIASVGSLLQDLPPDYRGIILGSGFIRESCRMLFPEANVLAVRGKLSSERMGLSSEGMVFGDPGLLVSQLLPRRSPKRYALGLLPHYVDRRNPTFSELLRKHPSEIKFIDIRKNNPLKVVAEIDACECIVSSSLHGLIFADALGIPNAWLFAPGVIGGRFKYDDYYSALGLADQMHYQISGSATLDKIMAWTSLKPQDAVRKIQLNLDRLFKGLTGLVKV